VIQLTDCLSAVLLAFTLAIGPRAAAPPRAPDVALETASGETLRLAGLRGKVIVIDFWASWCGPCKTSFPAIDALFREYRARGLEVIAVNLDERRRDADAFLAEHPHTLTVAFDPSGASAAAFHVRGMPSSFLIDRDGVVRFTHMGYSGNVEASYRRELALLLAEQSRP
jgi:thiol-disulfide isomerase/thioredoxin